MKTMKNKNWKPGTLSATALAVLAAAGYTGLSLTSNPAIAQETTETASTTVTPLSTKTASTTATPSSTETATSTTLLVSGKSRSGGSGGFGGHGGGRGGHGGGYDNLEGMDTSAPELELAPEQPDTEPVQATEKAEDAEYYDGQYYGDAVVNEWGTTQVVAVIEGGKLVDVLIAQYPNNDSKSDIINRNVLPTLISEAIEAQDADGVDFVSRATDSSKAFVASLDSALLDAAIGLDL